MMPSAYILHRANMIDLVTHLGSGQELGLGLGLQSDDVMVLK